MEETPCGTLRSTMLPPPFTLEGAIGFTVRRFTERYNARTAKLGQRESVGSVIFLYAYQDFAGRRGLGIWLKVRILFSLD